jgi:5-methylcytosine-specific restriction endonuclease McrA
MQLVYKLPIVFEDSNIPTWDRQLDLAARLGQSVKMSRADFILSFEDLDKIDPKYGIYALKRWDYHVNEKEKNRRYNQEQIQKQNKIRYGGHAYDRLTTVEMDLIFNKMSAKENLVIGDVVVPLESKRYKCYARNGVTCVRCGKVAHYFAVEKAKLQDTNTYHLNLYHKTDEGREIMMTVDHILPKSRGGTDDLINLQPMCIICNNRKGNDLEGEQVDLLKISTERDVTKLRDIENVYLGKKVCKKSGKPFKSTHKSNTVLEVVVNPTTRLPAFKFMEDDSVVDVRTCRLYE